VLTCEADRDRLRSAALTSTQVLTGIDAMHRLLCRGYSVLELVFVLGLVATVSVMTVPNLLARLDEYRVAGAARYVSARLQRARMDAVARSRSVAVRFSAGSDGRYVFTEFVDGNHNGILAPDLERSVDSIIGPPESLADNFAGIDFGTLAAIPPVDGGSQPPDGDPIRFGPGNTATFTPLGTSTPGSVYIRGKNTQYVVRVFGETGKTRVLKFNTRTREWKPL
jgi:type II secretory pathway pseudopilin PulG